MSDDGIVLSGQGLWMTYPSGEKRISVLEGVDCSIRGATSMSIRGESGCGKTTLLNILAGLERPDKGTITWEGQDIARLGAKEIAARRARFIGMVFQAFYLIPELNALENVMMPARMVGKVGAPERDRAAHLLGRVGLSERTHHLPAQLSGGERQRVAVARALMNKPSVVLADEPTGNLDEATAEGVITVLLEVSSEQGASLVLVTHNAAHAARAAIQGRLARHQLAV